MRFAKWQGLGNHYVIVEGDEWPVALSPARARLICDAHFGVGGDGILEIRTAGGAPRMIVWNPDGSNAESCGNGIRMVARYLHEQGRLPDDGAIETGGGRVRARVLDDGRVRVDMGPAVFPDGPVRQRLRVATDPAVDVEFANVSMGNPHAVINSADPDAVVRSLGPAIEADARFPDRTNVEFVRTEAPGEVTMRVWERGVGETMACGTGACAVAATAVVVDGHPTPVTIHLPGGDLVIDIDPTTHDVEMTGPAEALYSGVVSPGLRSAMEAAL
ncbi:MAG: diaminopimelate epimerase [Actinobacteria bacterium]|nr:diaminopimelate epimerase [Actinomycetota bacterium]